MKFAKPKNGDLPKKIVHIDKDYSAGGHGTTYFLGDNGKLYLVSEYSKFLGLGRQALLQRIQKHTIHAKNILSKRFLGYGPRGAGNAAWRKLGDRDRIRRLRSIPTAPFDSVIECPQAITHKEWRSLKYIDGEQI